MCGLVCNREIAGKVGQLYMKQCQGKKWRLCKTFALFSSVWMGQGTSPETGVNFSLFKHMNLLCWFVIKMQEFDYTRNMFFFLPVYDTTDCQITLKANESFDGCSAITGYCLPFVTAVSLATRMFDGLLEASLGQELHEVNGASICRACCWGVATAAWCWAEIWLYCSPSLKQICNTLFNPGTIINSLTTGFIS